MDNALWAVIQPKARPVFDSNLQAVSVHVGLCSSPPSCYKSNWLSLMAAKTMILHSLILTIHSGGHPHLYIKKRIHPSSIIFRVCSHLSTLPQRAWRYSSTSKSEDTTTFWWTTVGSQREGAYHSEGSKENEMAGIEFKE